MDVIHRRYLLLVALLALCLPLLGFGTPSTSDQSRTSSDPVLVYNLSGEITGVTTYAIQEMLGTAVSLDAQLVVVQLNTPGGEVLAVQNIMQMFANSPVPVLVYVPPAAIAASGGTYLLMASHIAAMGPAAQIGSCQPVAGSIPITEPKYLEFVITLMTEHAHLHERNETVATQFILENLNLGALEAQASNITEFVADSLSDLLTTLDDYTLIQRELVADDPTFRVVPTSDIGSYTFDQSWDFAGVASATRVTYQPNLGLVLLSFLAHPVVNFILLQIGIWGFVFSLNAPGYAGEIISVFCIVLALVGIGIIGIPVAGLLLMALGGALVVIEAKTDVGFAGAAGIGGIICFALGGIFFLPPGQWLIPAQAMWTFWGISIGVALMFAILFSYAIMKAAEARRLKSELEAERVVGKPGVAETNLNPDGRVRALGETWSAIAENPPIKAGESVVIVRLDGIRLVVRLAEKQDK